MAVQNLAWARSQAAALRSEHYKAAAQERETLTFCSFCQCVSPINVKGTIKLLTKAQKQGIKKVIYVSSSGVVGMKAAGVAGDELTPPDPQAIKNLYFKSKVLAEDAIYEFLKQHSLPVVLILPGWMFGPIDTHLAPDDTGARQSPTEGNPPAALAWLHRQNPPSLLPRGDADAPSSLTRTASAKQYAGLKPLIFRKSAFADLVCIAANSIR